MDKNNLALDYALRIIEELETLEFLEFEGIETLQDLEDREEEFERDQYSKAVDLLADYQEQAEEWGNLVFAYFADVLDIERGYGSAGDLRRITLVVTVGGPHAEIEFNRADNARVLVIWGADRYERSTSVPIVAEQVAIMFGGE